MDNDSKLTTLGFVLIGLVLMVWMWMQTPPPAAQHPAAQDTAAAHVQAPAPETHVAAPVVAVQGESTDSLGKFFLPFSQGQERILVIKTDYYTAEVSTKGGVIRKWDLNTYQSWRKDPVQLVDYDNGGDLSLLFTSSDGKLINTHNLYFTANFSSWQTVELTGDQSYVVDLSLDLGDGRRLVKKLTFTNGRYAFDADFQFVGLQSVISNYEYQIVWEHGLRNQERNSVDEASFAMAYAYSGGELTEIDATKPDVLEKRDINGTTSWVATRNKYFTAALLADEGKTQGAYLEGHRKTETDHGVHEIYTLALKMPLKGMSTETAHVQVYLGPLEYSVIKGYNRGLDQIMSLGAVWIIRPIAVYVMIPIFQLLHMVIPNYGWVIIVFSIIIKLALQPLTRTQMRSMKKMQALQPMMEEIREKYKDNQEKQSAATMNLYKEYGVNPASGCLPLLLQMPIMFALYSVLRGAIELRQAHFMFWITDLSIPESIMSLPFTVPFFGITEVSVLPIAMGVTMFLQQKSTVTDPRQKAMVWMMPILMTLMFFNLPSGLNLYYFVFNMLQIGQQMWAKNHGDSEPLRKVDPKKASKGIMAKLAAKMPQPKD